MTVSRRSKFRRAVAVYEWTMLILLAVAGMSGLASIVAPSFPVGPEVAAVLLLSLLSIALGLDRVIIMLGLQRDMEHMAESVGSAIARHQRRLDGALSGQNRILKRIETRISETDPDRPGLPIRFEELLDDYLGQVFRELLLERVQRLSNALQNGEIILESEKDFRYFYLKTLKYYVGRETHFKATSLVNSDYFWDEETLRAVAEFVSHPGSQMERIFLVNAGYERDDKVLSLLRAQHEAGIGVQVARRDHVAPELRDTLIMVADDLAWEVRTFGEGRPVQVVITTNELKISELRRKIDSIPCRVFEAA